MKSSKPMTSSIPMLPKQKCYAAEGSQYETTSWHLLASCISHLSIGVRVAVVLVPIFHVDILDLLLSSLVRHMLTHLFCECLDYCRVAHEPHQHHLLHT